MSVPKYFNDGDYSKPQQVGPGMISYPFFNFQDAKSFEMKLTYRIAAVSYKIGKPMTRVKLSQGYAYLVEEEPPSHVGNGIYEYTQTYASVPIERYEATTITHSRQEVILGGLVETQEVVPALVKYEYSLKPLKQIDAPKAILVSSTNISGGDAFESVWLTWGGFGTFTGGKLYLAEDTEVGIYKAGIFFRRSVIIRWKPLALRH